jgi:excisionase family DNA binding protein
MPELWRVWRVAKLLDISKKRVYQMVQEGKIEAVRLGPRSMRITKDSVDLFISNGREENRVNLGIDLAVDAKRIEHDPETGRTIRHPRFRARRTTPPPQS